MNFEEEVVAMRGQLEDTQRRLEKLEKDSVAETLRDLRFAIRSQILLSALIQIIPLEMDPLGIAEVTRRHIENGPEARSLAKDRARLEVIETELSRFAHAMQKLIGPKG